MFLIWLKQNFQQWLLIKMVPFERTESLKNTFDEYKKPRMAAVMMLFYPKNGMTHLVLIVHL
jgi:hypothetical protein